MAGIPSRMARQIRFGGCRGNGPRWQIALAVAGALAAGCGRSAAQTSIDVWNNVTGSWFTADDWTGHFVPTSSTEVLIESDGPTIGTGTASADGIYLTSTNGNTDLNIVGGTLNNSGPLVINSITTATTISLDPDVGSPTVLNNDGPGTDGLVLVNPGYNGIFGNYGGTATVGAFAVAAGDGEEGTLSLMLTGSSGAAGTTNVEGTTIGTATYAIYYVNSLAIDNASTLNIESNAGTIVQGTIAVTSGIINNNDGGLISVSILRVGSDSSGAGIIHAGTGSLYVYDSLVVSGGGIVDVGTTSSTAGINISGSGYAKVYGAVGTISAAQVSVSGSGTLAFIPGATPSTFFTSALNTSTSALVTVSTGDLIVSNTLSISGSSIVSVGTTASDTTPGLSVTGSGVVSIAVPTGLVGSLTAPTVNVSGSGTLALGSGALLATNITVSTSGFASVTSGVLAAEQSLQVLGANGVVTVGDTATAPGINVGGSGLILVGTGSFAGTLSAPQISVSGSGELDVATGTMTASQSLSVLGTLAVVNIGTTGATPGVNLAGTGLLIVGSAGLAGTLTTPALNISGTAALKLGNGTSGAITVTTNQFNISGLGSMDIGRLLTTRSIPELIEFRRPHPRRSFSSQRFLA